MEYQTEEEYISYLKRERHMFAWCLVTYLQCSLPDAQQEALEFYPYEDDVSGRGFKFHRLAWEWAMLKINGPHYWETNPNLDKPSVEYLIEEEGLAEK